LARSCLSLAEQAEQNSRLDLTYEMPLRKNNDAANKLCPLLSNSGHSVGEWRGFVASVEALPPDQAVSFWQEAQARAAFNL
jgi:hypothetical protein